MTGTLKRGKGEEDDDSAQDGVVVVVVGGEEDSAAAVGDGGAEQHKPTAVEELLECLRAASLQEELCCLLRLPHGYRLEPPVFRWNQGRRRRGVGEVGGVAAHHHHHSPSSSSSPWARPRQSIPLPPPPPGVEPVPCHKHSDYAVYFKLLDMGCPTDAVKLKMTLEGRVLGLLGLGLGVRG